VRRRTIRLRVDCTVYYDTEVTVDSELVAVMIASTRTLIRDALCSSIGTLLLPCIHMQNTI
jgi:hypothetical protein